MMIGVLGGGQLGRMLALAGIPLGHRFRFFDTDPDPCAAQVSTIFRGDYASSADLARFAEGLDVVTCEFENIPVAALKELSKIRPVLPSPKSFEIAQDRVTEKTFLNSLGIETAPFAAVDSPEDLAKAVAAVGLPAILKTRRMGYDGRGQAKIERAEDALSAFTRLGGKGLVLEGFVAFEREVSMIAVRAVDGAMCFYPLCENAHVGGVLATTRIPARDAARWGDTAERSARRLAEALGHVGTLVVEFFVTPNALVANEFAPRVHNSGHWTIEGADTSQFENHIRAVTAAPLGAPRVRQLVGMVNLIGTPPPLAPLLRLAGVFPHVYGKSAKSGRKVGHVTVLADDERQLSETIDSVEKLISAGSTSTTSAKPV